jgi:hypothetical protein
MGDNHLKQQWELGQERGSAAAEAEEAKEDDDDEDEERERDPERDAEIHGERPSG